MYVINLKIRGNEYEILSSDIKIEYHIESHLRYDDIPEYYSDTEEFIAKNVSYTIQEAVKKLYLIQTNQRGWDTYDSAVYCAYTEFEAILFSEENMGKDYKNTAKCIGLANEDLEIGEVCSSFNAG